MSWKPWPHSVLVMAAAVAIGVLAWVLLELVPRGPRFATNDGTDLVFALPGSAPTTDDPTQHLLTEAGEALRHTRLERSETLARESLEHRESAQGWLMLARSLVWQGELPESRAALRRAWELGHVFFYRAPHADASWESHDGWFDIWIAELETEPWISPLEVTVPPSALSDDEIQVRIDAIEQAARRSRDHHLQLVARHDVVRWKAACLAQRAVEEGATADEAELVRLESIWINDEWPPAFWPPSVGMAGLEDSQALLHRLDLQSGPERDRLWARTLRVKAEQTLSLQRAQNPRVQERGRREREESLRAAHPLAEGETLAQVLLGRLALDPSPRHARTFVDRLFELADELDDGEELLLETRRVAPLPYFEREGLPSLDLETIDGGRFTDEDLKGQVTLIDFWATWCPPCRAELPGVVEVLKRHRHRGFQVLGIATEGPHGLYRGDFKSWCEGHEVTWPQVHVNEPRPSRIARAFGVVGIPSLFLVDREGRLVAAGRSLRGEGLEEELSKLFEAESRQEGSPAEVARR
ncbi:MAG: TlpA disulfide reductase family protein [Acidobacteriota bacterium]